MRALIASGSFISTVKISRSYFILGQRGRHVGHRNLVNVCGFEFHPLKYGPLRALLLMLQQSCGNYREIATWETSQMMRCGTPNKKSVLEKTFSCCLFREVSTFYVCNGPTFFPLSLLPTQRSRSHSAGPMGQDKFSCPVRQQDTGSACPTIVQISSDILNSVEPPCSVTDFSFWTRKGLLEGPCCSPSIRLRLKNLSSHL